MAGHAALQLPRVEEERPVDERHQLRQRHARPRGARGTPAPAGPPSPSRRAAGLPSRPRTTAAASPASRRTARAASSAPHARPPRTRSRAADSAGSRRRRPRASVEHVDDRLRVLRRDLHRRVLPAGGGAADEQRHLRCRGAPSPGPPSTISSSDGVIRPLRPMMSTFSSAAVRRITSWAPSRRGR